MFFVFLVTGKSAEGYSAQDIEKMQAAHLANFGQLYDRGLLKLVGPCRDPEKVKRGIVLLDVSDRSKLEDCFHGDPYVQSGLMRIQVIPVTVPMMNATREELPRDEPIAEHTIAILEAASDSVAGPVDRSLWTGLPEESRPAAVLIADEPGPVRLIMFFGSSKPAEVEALLKQRLSGKSAGLLLSVFTQWLPKRMLKFPEERQVAKALNACGPERPCTLRI